MPGLPQGPRWGGKQSISRVLSPEFLYSEGETFIKPTKGNEVFVKNKMKCLRCSEELKDLRIVLGKGGIMHYAGTCRIHKTNFIKKDWQTDMIFEKVRKVPSRALRGLAKQENRLL